MEYIVIFVTASNKQEAKKISNSLVSKKLAACCNISAPIESLFFWKGDVCNENEVLLMIKSTKKNFEKIATEVKKLHSYDTPEIIALPILDGSKEYLQWIEDETE